MFVKKNNSHKNSLTVYFYKHAFVNSFTPIDVYIIQTRLQFGGLVRKVMDLSPLIYNFQDLDESY